MTTQSPAQSSAESCPRLDATRSDGATSNNCGGRVESCHAWEVTVLLEFSTAVVPQNAAQ